MTAPPCTTCRWHHVATGRCGAFDLPAELARARPMLCGPEGADHSDKPDPRFAWVESWWFIGGALGMVFLAIAASLIVNLFPAIADSLIVTLFLGAS